MEARRWTGWLAGLAPALLASLHLVLATPAAVQSVAAEARPTTLVSSPRESLPLPVHDEATCAFCQAAAFAPHSSRPVGVLTLAPAESYRLQHPQDQPLLSSASTGPTRSRAPPVIRSV